MKIVKKSVFFRQQFLDYRTLDQVNVLNTRVNGLEEETKAKDLESMTQFRRNLQF